MTRTVAAYVATLVVFLAIDSVWLTLTGDALYRPVLKDILLDGFRPVPAILFYLIYMAGLLRFAVLPGMASGNAVKTALDGAAFGLTAYATYDLTNQATLKYWTTGLTLADLAWGTILSASAASIACWLMRKVFRLT